MMKGSVRLIDHLLDTQSLGSMVGWVNLDDVIMTKRCSINLIFCTHVIICTCIFYIVQFIHCIRKCDNDEEVHHQSYILCTFVCILYIVHCTIYTLSEEM